MVRLDAARRIGHIPDDLMLNQPTFMKSKTENTNYRIIKASGCFDHDWYQSEYRSGADLLNDPIFDYLENNDAAEKRPCAYFDLDYYVSTNPDVDFSRTHPFVHYIQAGWKEFRNPSPLFNVWWYRINHLGIEEATTNPLEHCLRIGRSSNLSTGLAAGATLSASAKRDFNTKSIALFNTIATTALQAHLAARSLTELSLWDLADMFHTRVCDLAPHNPTWHIALVTVLLKRKAWPRILTVLEHVFRLTKPLPDWYFTKGLANEQLRRWEQAAEAYRAAIRDGGENRDWQYRLGYCEQKAGNFEAAETAYERAVALSSAGDGELGVGLLHESGGVWDLAAAAYRDLLATQEGNVDLQVRLGYCLECCFRWEDAEALYRSSPQLAANPALQYRLGYVLERQGRYGEASNAYAAACSLNDAAPADWHYRLGYALYRAGHYKQACDAWLGATPDPAEPLPLTPAALLKLEEHLKHDYQDPDVHSRLGMHHESWNEHDKAVTAYAAAAARRCDYSPLDHYRLARAYWKLGQYEAACLAFLDTRQFKRACDLPLGNKAPDLKNLYAEYLCTLPVVQTLIFYESFHGASITCNPYAVFRELVDDETRGQFTHVWSIKSFDAIPLELQSRKNVIFVTPGSALYVRYLATAKYLINNTTFPSYFLRRDEQKYLNTWHGTPLKTLGKDVSGSSFDHKNVLRNLLQTTHLIYPNEHTRKALMESYYAADLFTGAAALTGYPRIDLMLNASPERRNQLREELGLSDGKPVVLFAPTFRGTPDSPAFNVDGLMLDLRTLIEGCAAQVVLSCHHYIRRIVSGSGLGIKILPPDIDTTEFLSVTDVLVTDYSSIVFDFLASGKPAIIYTPDIEEYRAERGFYFDPRTIPALHCDSRAGLARLTNEALDGRQPVMEGRLKVPDLCGMEDGHATQRTIDFLFNHDAPSVASNSKTKILFYAGSFIPNGITSSILRLAGAIPADQFSISVITDPWAMESYPQRMERFGQLPEHVGVLGRVSFPVASREEEWINSLFVQHPESISERMTEVLTEMYQRDFSRLFGSTRFDWVIDFCGYACYWTALFGLGKTKDSSSVLYFHNDMEKETNSRFPGLDSLLHLTRRFDKLVSVSDSVGAANKRHVSSRYGADPEKFCVIRNSIDAESILNRASEPLPAAIAEWLGGGPLLGSVGRISKEKGFDRLIHAFSRFREVCPDARLLIAGQGPEKRRLQRLVEDLGLASSVRLIGYLENPYPFIRELDLFVLPSDYEGQPIVLFEALVLGRPIVATNIPGSACVLENTGALLVPPSEDGVCEGLMRFISGHVPLPYFDPQRYQREALEDFLGLIGETDKGKNQQKLPNRQLRTLRPELALAAQSVHALSLEPPEDFCTDPAAR